MAKKNATRKTSSPDRAAAPAARGGQPFVESYSLPARYDTTNLTLIPRDPHWVHAYWDVSSASVQAAEHQTGQGLDRSGYVIRMHEITHVDFDGANANRTFDIPVGRDASNWYINLWNDNARYCADLGVRAGDGTFVQLARSNIVSTPRANPSDRSDRIWMEVRDNKTLDPYVVGTIEREKKRRLAEGKVRGSKAVPSSRKRKIYLTEDDIRAYYIHLSPLLRDIISMRIAKHDRKAPADVKVTIPKDTMRWEDYIARGVPKGSFVKRLVAGASEQLVELGQGGASELLPGGASEQQQHDIRRKFFFEIWTELIVYGRTEPDATVLLGDRKVDLRPDGTFTLRYHLPDGRIPFDFAAYSRDRVDKREITTAVERAKTISNP